jgi:hypothetical protein
MADMTPAAWLALLEKRLDARWARMHVLDEYFEGRHPMAFATSQFREAFGSLLATMSDNWCQIVVTSSRAPAEGAGLPVRAGSERRR